MGEVKKLPSDWDELSADEQMMWMMDNYGTDEDDERGYMIFDKKSMPEDVLKAFNEMIGLIY